MKFSPKSKTKTTICPMCRVNKKNAHGCCLECFQSNCHITRCSLCSNQYFACKLDDPLDIACCSICADFHRMTIKYQSVL